MRPLKMILKDYEITIVWLKDEIKKDIKEFISSILTPKTYISKSTNIIMDYIKALQSIFTSPTYGLYWASSLFIFSILFIKNVFWRIFFGIIFFSLTIFSYIHLKYKSGEPLKAYKEKYFKY